MAMLVVEGVDYEYGDRAVLRGFDLEAREGEMVGVVGPNGAGKTTLMKVVSGVFRPSKGRVLIGGSDVGSLSDGERARLVSVVPQNPELPLSFSAIDLVLMGRNPHLRLFQWPGTEDLEVAKRAMQLTDVWPLASREIGSLSGGERQRTVVAMAVAQEAPVLLLDEPTSNLDLAHQTGIMDLTRDLQERHGGTILVAMHDLTLAAQYCDRVVMLERGRAYADGPPRDVLTADNIARVYGTEVFVTAHPQGGLPACHPGDGPWRPDAGRRKVQGELTGPSIGPQGL